MKKIKSIKIAILSLIFLFILVSTFSKNNADTLTGFATTNASFFPNDQTVTGPGFFPFSNSQEVIDIFNQQCPDPNFIFDGPDSLFGSTLEIGPAGNSAETGSRDILVFDMNGNVSVDFLNAFPLANPNTMTAFDPSMGDILGLSLVPGPGFPMSATFMITTTFNCDDGMSTSTSSTTSSTSSSSSSGGSSGQSVSTSSSSGSLTGPQVISHAIDSEKSARAAVDIKEHLKKGSPLSPSMAIDDLKSSLSDLQDLQNRFQGENDVMLGMSTVGTELMDAINADNEAIMALDPLKNTDPDLTNGEFTKGLSKAKKLIGEALRIKGLVEGKLKKLEKK